MRYWISYALRAPDFNVIGAADPRDALKAALDYERAGYTVRITDTKAGGAYSIGAFAQEHGIAIERPDDGQ